MPVPDVLTHAQLRALKVRYAGIKTRHKKKGGAVEDFMSFERYLQLAFSPCVYCGAEPHGVMTCKDGTVLHVSSIDRIDSTRLYDDSNVVPACSSCNMGKGRMTASDWFDHVVQIYEHQHLERREAPHGS